MPITINGSGTITGLSVGGLPDGIVDTDMIANSAVTSAKSSGLGGLTVAETWCLTTATAGDADPITGWTKPTSNGRGSLGTGMTESSGIFTFPSTGFWQVGFHANVTHNADDRYHQTRINYSSDSGSNYTMVAEGGSGGGTRPSGQPNVLGDAFAQVILDVTNISTARVKFDVNAYTNTSNLWENANGNSTSVWFIKLGDT